GEVPLALQGAQVIVHTVGGTDPHVRPDFAERRRVAALVDRLADVVKHLLLAIGQALHRTHTLLNSWRDVKSMPLFFARSEFSGAFCARSPAPRWGTLGGSPIPPGVSVVDPRR